MKMFKFMGKNIDLQNVIKSVDWLIFDGVVKNKRELAERLGYTESSFSQIINGKVSLSERFIKKLHDFDNRLNLDWLLTGEGEMLKKTEKITDEKGFTDIDFQRSILGAISAVEKIAESNRVLAESNHELTTTNKILATSNTELVQKLAGLLDEIREMRSTTMVKYPPLSDQSSQVASDIDSQYRK